MAVISSLCMILLLFLAVSDVGISSHDWFPESMMRRCSENEPPIRFPFHFNERQHQSDHYPTGFGISCDSRKGTLLELPMLSAKLLVRNIDCASQEVHVDGYCLLSLLLLLENRNGSSSIIINFPFQFKYDRQKKYPSSTILNCSSTSFSSCSFDRLPSDAEIQSYYDSNLQHCTKMYDTLSIPHDLSAVPLTWSKPDCRPCEAKHMGCRFNKDHDHESTECFHIPKPRKGKSKILSVICSPIFTILLSSLVSCSIIVAATFYVFTLHRDGKETRQRIEKFLEDYIALKPSRYAYSDIKKITNQFKDKLGQGAYGTVFKGNLSNDILVAVKILNNSKGNGEELLNEVATIGQIHHVNVVRLVGYCAEGFKRALVYEFLPNDSLDKYISLGVAGDARNRSLSWETLKDIALGIAKGIEYLHQGCEQRILHFDIKPHNILLDHNFKPKISNFGLAKLYSKDQSVVSMTATRGTIGYIAPEVFSKNFGNVSYKSDVYSFGMLLLEMVGGRKNSKIIENTDEFYYPEWIYNLLEEGKDLSIQIEVEEDAKIAKELAIVGLWCIQWHPVSRPTMKVVVQMLEGVEELTIPPNPFDSTGPLKTNTKLPARRITGLELETIAE